jgi:hypothetical protein
MGRRTKPTKVFQDANEDFYTRIEAFQKEVNSLLEQYQLEFDREYGSSHNCCNSYYDESDSFILRDKKYPKYAFTRDLGWV